MSAFEVVVLGVGDAFSAVHYPTAFLLVHGDFVLAIDCPDRYRAVLKDAGARSGQSFDLADIDHFLVTHVHGDHMNGLEGVAFYKHFVEGKRVRLVTTPEVRSVLWDQRLRASMGRLWDGHSFRAMSFDDYFDFVALDWVDETTVGPFRIRARRTVHHVPTSALLVEVGGRRLGYSSDTAFDRDLISFLEPADLILHETNLGPAHTAYEDLAALPADLRARMLLVHVPDGFDTEARKIQVAREGSVLRVGAG